MPIRKFDEVRRAIQESTIPARICEPAPATEEDLLRVHTPEYIRAIQTGEPRALAESQKFPWSLGLAQSVLFTAGGCIEALFAALEEGVSANLASGFHHAHADHGEGFCTFHGLMIALEKARAAKKIRRALILDLDLHYGNGTASLLTTRPHFFALSLYGSWYKNNQAFREVDRERAEDTENSWSVPIPNGSDGATYLALLEKHLWPAITRARPDFLFYQAGADPLRDDPYSPLDVGLEDLYQRDLYVFRVAKEANIPIAWVLAGGYTRDIRVVVEAHLNTFRAAAQVFEAD